MKYDDPHAKRELARFCAICGGRGGGPVRWVGGMPEPASGDTGSYVHRECVVIVRQRRRADQALSDSAQEAVP